MKKLNQYIFNKRVAKVTNESPREKRYVDYKSANTILLIFESDYIEKNRFIRKAIEQLTRDGKKVFTWGFLDKKMTSTAILPSFKILDRSTIDWFGCPKAPFLKELMENEYDMLIDLTLTDILPLQYVCLYANAALKTGMSRSMNQVLDFVIKVPQPEPQEISELTEKDQRKIEFQNLNESLFHTDQQYLFEQLIFYLKKIQTKD
ncbi:MAG: DUF6913 domain-containing protein [Paludibacteraceae bacterium]